MLYSFVKNTLRQLGGNLLYTGINIVGLGIGLACCLLILLYVRFELDYERGFANHERIYRVSREFFPAEGARLRIPASANAPFTPALLQDYPQHIAQMGRIWGGGTQLKTDELSATEADVRFADQSIIDIFGFEWLAGDAATALLEPNRIVLTETLAQKYFGTVDAVGQRLNAMDRFDLQVSGVIRDLPPDTHLSLSGLISLNSITALFGPGFLEQWNSNTDFHSYLLLHEGASIDAIVADIPNLIERHVGEGASAFSTLRVMNIADIHLDSDRDEEWQPHGNRMRVYSFAAIAFGILLIACVNFMSIATARSSTRAREVGMRKTVGASRAQLVLQFLGEAALVALIACVLALVLVELLLPAFRTFAGVPLDIAYFNDADFVVAAALLTFFVVLFSGSYPAFYLTGFQTTRVLKGELTRGSRGLQLRNAMVVFQFSVVIALLVATAVVHLQRRHADRMDLGFDKDNIVILDSASATGFKQDWPLLKQELLADPAISSVTASHFLPFGFNDNQIPVQREGAGDTRIQYMLVDYHFFATYDIPVLSGRDFDSNLATDAGTLAAGNEASALSFVLNASAAAALGLSPDVSVDTRLRLGDDRLVGNVVGVVQDTLFESIRSAARPLLFILVPPDAEQAFQRFTTAAIRIKPEAATAALAHIDSTWRRLYPGQPLSRHFLDTDFQAQYQADAKQAQLFSWFSGLAALIACFGLFGLASFNAERRTKEIGVRKVMGGSVWQIVLLLTNDFSRLVLLANVIAWPLAWVLMQRWLEQFAYRIDLTPLVFIGSGLIALCVAWVTVGGTAAKAASAKPVLALRYE